MLPEHAFRVNFPARGWLVALALLGCRGGLRDGVFEKEGVRYRVGALPSGWRQVELEENDLALFAEGSPHAIAVNSTCEGHGDPSLQVLTSHLLFGFTDRHVLVQRAEPLDGREGLRSRVRAKLDGVPVELLLVVLKKDGCVYDFTYTSPPERFDEKRSAFEALLENFTTEARR